MSANSSQPKRSTPPYDCDSPYCVNIVVEVSGEFTSRPVSAERRAVLLAEREEIARWLKELNEQESQASPPTQPDRNDVHFT